MGRLVKFKIGDAASPEVFTSINAKQVGISINGDNVDVTDNESTGWRELVSGGAIRSLSVSLSGAFKAGTQEVLLRTKSDTQVLFNGQAVFGDGTVKYSGQWKCTKYETSGPHDGAILYSATIDSSGVMTLA